MDERVREFLDSKRFEVEKKKEAKKAETLISLGLYEKVYSPYKEYLSEYPFDEWDNKERKTKYYKKVPLAVSDEEFEEILNVSNKKSHEQATDTNPIATTLSIIAWIIFIGGFIAGIAFGNREVSGTYYDYEEFSFAIAIIYWSVSLISGIMMLGFAEIIKLLQYIKNKK